MKVIQLLLRLQEGTLGLDKRFIAYRWNLLARWDVDTTNDIHQVLRLLPPLVPSCAAHLGQLL